jgi:hypothetical protein
VAPGFEFIHRPPRAIPPKIAASHGGGCQLHCPNNARPIRRSTPGWSAGLSVEWAASDGSDAAFSCVGEEESVTGFSESGLSVGSVLTATP